MNVCVYVCVVIRNVVYIALFMQSPISQSPDSCSWFLASLRLVIIVIVVLDIDFLWMI